MDDDVGAQLQQAAAVPGAKAIVDHQEAVVAMRNVRQRVNIAQLDQRIDGVSTNSSRVFGVIRRSQSATIGQIRVIRGDAETRRYLSNSTVVLPKMLRELTIWSPWVSSPMQVARMADIPDAVATQHSPPSIAARRSSNARTVGLVNRE